MSEEQISKQLKMRSSLLYESSAEQSFFGVAFQSISRCCWCLTDEENSVWAALRAPWRAIKGVITH